ncbi:chordin [Notothenia coriiceps]|uniref:Chordin n=1 Tax=Notothenia coriiceps TaxID=8208 RepID=A0A6I9MSW4_9TELE|nr:PREDICTED: chordin-like [Notothenia coriiceps]
MLGPLALRSLLCVLSCAWLRTGASRLKSPALPIQSEREPLPSKGLAGCSFGGRYYSLEDTWHPDLGEPFGVMHCVQCYCETQKSRRGKVFGKVNCKNIKQDCPELDCSDAVLRPGHCCKSCPTGNTHTQHKHLLLLSSGFQRHIHPYVPFNKVTSSRYEINQNMFLLPPMFAFFLPLCLFSRSAEQLLEAGSGSIDFSFNRIKRTFCICGVWKNLGKPLIRQLQTEQMRIVMSSASGGQNEVEGKIIKHRALFAEPVLVPIRVQLVYRQHVLREIRANITSHVSYNNTSWSAVNKLPTPLAGHFVSPPVRTGASGHAWVSVDRQCHLHYEIVVTGLSRTDDLTLNAHLHGLAEIGELDESSATHKRLLTGFYGSQAQGVLKDISVELLQHLDQGSAFIQVSTKTNPRGEIRGRVHVQNNCELGTRGEMEDSEFDDLFVKDPEELKKDPHTCFFENQHQAHGSRWTPNYDRCFSCSCQKRTVICDPVICPVLTCSKTLQPEDQCCPVCDDSKDVTAPEKVEENPEGCYFEGDQKMHAPGTTWHPFVPPFGYIKCAVCTCKGSSGEVHCEKVTCPVLSCSHPVRRNPSDCCKECPEEEGTPPGAVGLEHSDMMQADGPRHCKFGKSFYQNSDNWHPWVPLVGEMKCINCWCDHGVTKCQRKQCPALSCTNFIRKEGVCCPECLDSKEEEVLMTKAPDKRRNWRH